MQPDRAKYAHAHMHAHTRTYIYANLQLYCRKNPLPLWEHLLVSYVSSLHPYYKTCSFNCVNFAHTRRYTYTHENSHMQPQRIYNKQPSKQSLFVFMCCCQYERKHMSVVVCVSAYLCIYYSLCVSPCVFMSMRSLTPGWPPLLGLHGQRTHHSPHLRSRRGGGTSVH